MGPTGASVGMIQRYWRFITAGIGKTHPNQEDACLVRFWVADQPVQGAVSPHCVWVDWTATDSTWNKVDHTFVLNIFVPRLFF